MYLIMCATLSYIVPLCCSSILLQEFEVASDIDIMLKSVVCLNSDETFANCSFLDDGHNCRHREDIYLICGELYSLKLKTR